MGEVGGFEAVKEGPRNTVVIVEEAVGANGMKVLGAECVGAEILCMSKDFEAVGMEEEVMGANAAAV